jgi:hypothetical protein
MTTESNLLPLKDFKQEVEIAPLFSIDLVVLNPKNEVLIKRARKKVLVCVTATATCLSDTA